MNNKQAKRLRRQAREVAEETFEITTERSLTTTTKCKKQQFKFDDAGQPVDIFGPQFFQRDGGTQVHIGCIRQVYRQLKRNYRGKV